MKITFRVDASTQMGIGHVMRCLALAEVLQENGANVGFICRKHDGNLIDKIRTYGFNVSELELLQDVQTDNKLAHSYWLGVTQQHDAKECINILQLEKVDWLIVDHYALDEDWHNELNKYCNKLMVIDDIADRKFQCDVLLNQNLGICKDDYKDKVPNNCELLLGCDYALFRPEFLKYRSKSLFKRKSTREVKNILVSMGGSDNENITYKILQKLDGNFNIVVVLGAISVHKEMIEKYAVGKTIKVVFDVVNMAQLMFDADLSIGAGGATSWERCCLGLPTLMYITADNQKNVAKNLNKSGAVKIVRNLKSDLTEISSNFNLWINMSNQATKVCDGMGGLRFLEILERSVK
jgi:UDP-2,4-diacetamido-2,4,6-trideoxy-beta-L-altropyranose hydrolase